MKKTFIILGALFLLVLAVLIIVPFFFKDQIAEIVKTEANKNLLVILNFEDIGLNLFEGFPNPTLSLNDITLVRKEPPDGDTLISASALKVTVDLWSIVSGDKIIIKGMELDEPDILLFVSRDGISNYNIVKESFETDIDTTGSSANISLESIVISGGNFVYVNRTSGIAIALKNLNYEGSGDFGQDNFSLNNQISVDELSFESDGIKYLNKVSTDLLLDLDVDLSNNKYVIKDNELKLNELLIKLSGMIEIKEEDIIVDAAFNSPGTDLKNIMSLIPALYSKDFADIQASGTTKFSGILKGTYNKNKLPAINIKLEVNDGSVKYADMSSTVNDINIDLNVTNPGAPPDKTVINLKKLKLNFDKDPFEASLMLKTPVSDPFIDTEVKGKLDLSNIQKTFKLDNVSKLSGLVESDFKISGSLSNIEQNKYENVSASGMISLSKINFLSDDFSEEINVQSGILTLTPQKFKLSELNINLGESDISANGELDDLVSYLLSDGTLKGTLQINSNYLNLNPFLAGDEKEQTTTDSTSEVSSVDLPGNIYFTMKSNIKNLIYDNLDLENVKGLIILKNKKLTLQNLTMGMLDGIVIADGSYETADEGPPSISFNLDINDANITKTFDSFLSVKKFVPMAKNITGNFSSKLGLKTNLNSDMTPVWQSFNSTGSLLLGKTEVINFKPFEILGNNLSIDELKNPAINNASTTFKIKNGRFYLNPISYKVLDYDVTLEGSNGIDESLDYSMKIAIPASRLKQQANESISGIFGKDISLISSDKVNINALIKGTIDSPNISMSGSDIVKETTKQVEEEVKQQIEEVVEKEKEKIEEKVEEKTDSLAKDLKKEVEKTFKNFFKKKK